MKEKPAQDVMSCDVAVIGGGPAGAATATLLAREGRDVVVFEKDHHPRFHIGESLIPQTLPLLEQLGVLDQVDKTVGLLKPGAHFHSDTHPNVQQTYYFREAWDKQWPHAYEVRRNEFDKMLFDNAKASGARAFEGARVVAVNFKDDGSSRIRVRLENGEEQTWAARYVVDASGRDTLLSSLHKLKQKNRRHNSAALYGHYRNVPRGSGEDEGNITVYWFEHGWFWLIPLKGGIMSVGAVCWPEYLKTRDCPPAEFLERTWAMSPSLSKRMENAELEGEVRATGNFTYFSRTAAGKGYLLVGDAFAFLDPVFSSGIHLALTGAFKAAATVDAILDNPRKQRQLTREYERYLRRGMKVFAWFIYRFNTVALHNLFMSPRDVQRMPEAVTTMLAGDVFRKTPVRWPMFLFRMVYYVTAIANYRATLGWKRRRRRNVRMVFTGGTTPVDSQ
ncbi:MAG TPA: NAD(P)/FAD-dependent oxidoreductase [Gammaproteobacteria bacterium]|nr:NAD(P)/FAD-dependent oxidoreductase [Gammaproteobacteria bacterium]